MDLKQHLTNQTHTRNERVPDTKWQPMTPEYCPTLILKYQSSLPETDRPARVLRRQTAPKGTPDKPKVRMRLSDVQDPTSKPQPVQDPTSKPQPAKLITTTA